MKAPVPIFSRISALATRHPAAWAALVCGLALAGFSQGIDDYSHLQHPIAWLGAEPLPHARPFNLLVFVLPGLLVAWTALRLRGALAMPDGGTGAAPRWAARIGAQLALLSALAFALQGLLPLDATDLDGVRSGRHAAAWMAWWIAFVAGGGLLVLGLRGLPAWRTAATVSGLAAILVLACVLVLPHLLPAGLAQRLAFAAWFAWAIHADAVADRGQP